MLIYWPPIPEVIRERLPSPSPAQYYARHGTRNSWLRVIGGWIERSRQRHALAQLDGRLLADAGISRTAAAHEIAKPFWR